MTVTEAGKLVGRRGLLTVIKGQLQVLVTIQDVRTVWNRIDVRVTPVTGSGSGWVALESVQLNGDGGI